MKIPTEFRRRLDESYGPDLFVTSIEGDCAHLYPLQVWEEIEGRLAKLPSTHPARRRFLERVNYYGQQVGMDAQGRILLPQILRESAEMNGEVVVSAHLDHLRVWNHARFQERLSEQPLTEEDFRVLSEHGI